VLKSRIRAIDVDAPRVCRRREEAGLMEVRERVVLSQGDQRKARQAKRRNKRRANGMHFAGDDTGEWVWLLNWCGVTMSMEP
jgi:hypothetical protein